MTAETMDLSGLDCPLPSIRTKRRLRDLDEGDTLTVICTDPLAAVDIPFLVSNLGHELKSLTDDGSRIVIEIGVRANKDDRGVWPPVD